MHFKFNLIHLPHKDCTVVRCGGFRRELFQLILNKLTEFVYALLKIFINLHNFFHWKWMIRQRTRWRVYPEPTFTIRGYEGFGITFWFKVL